MSDKLANIFKENKLSCIIFFLVMGFAAYIFYDYKVRVEDEIQENYIDTQDVMRNDKSDEVLRNLYRNVHNLEAMDRIEIAQNKGLSPGGDQGTNQEHYLQEQVFNEGSRLRSLAREDIAKRRVPYQAENPSPIGDTFDGCHFGNCQINMDYNERILGIPSAPGSYHGYWHNP